MNTDIIVFQDYVLIMYYVFMILQEDSIWVTQTLRTL